MKALNRHCLLRVKLLQAESSRWFSICMKREINT